MDKFSIPIEPKDPKQRKAEWAQAFEDGAAVAIDFSHAEELVGRLLTIIDATYTDPEQRRAQKRIVKSEVYDWMHDHYAYQHPDKYDAAGHELIHPLSEIS